MQKDGPANIQCATLWGQFLNSFQMKGALWEGRVYCAKVWLFIPQNIDFKALEDPQEYATGTLVAQQFGKLLRRVIQQSAATFNSLIQYGQIEEYVFRS